MNPNRTKPIPHSRCTLVSTETWTKGAQFLQLPFFAQDPDKCILSSAEDYGQSVLARFAELFARIGPGEHQFTLRFSPRGLINTEGDPDDFCFDAKGVYLTLRSAMVADPKLGPVLKSLHGQHAADENAAHLKAAFKMTLTEAECSGKAGSSKPPPFAAQWPGGEVKECLDIARRLAATGPCGAEGQKLAKTSTPAHIILVPNQFGMLGIQEHSKTGSKTGDNRLMRKTQAFHAVALFKGPEETGCMCEFRCEKLLFEWPDPVANPEFKCAGFGMHGNQCTGKPVPNEEIDAAIERDAEFVG